ncbi:MAG TPA: hypothetical protein VMU60_06775, partial [Syntrophobacteria bacterium]|nr:hypothetical protein [Syntrophobacteria bacterium]
CGRHLRGLTMLADIPLNRAPVPKIERENPRGAIARTCKPRRAHGYLPGGVVRRLEVEGYSYRDIALKSSHENGSDNTILTFDRLGKESGIFTPLTLEFLGDMRTQLYLDRSNGLQQGSPPGKSASDHGFRVQTTPRALRKAGNGEADALDRGDLARLVGRLRVETVESAETIGSDDDLFRRSDTDNNRCFG